MSRVDVRPSRPPGSARAAAAGVRIFRATSARVWPVR